MLIPIEKLLPFVAAGFIGVHGKAAIEKRFTSIFDQPRIAVAKYNMHSVLRAIEAQQFDEANLKSPRIVAYLSAALLVPKRRSRT